MDRRAIALIIAIVTFLAFQVNLASAISFTASVSPTQTEVGNKSVLVNFTITNSNGPTNVTVLNISLPSNFVYAGGIGEDATTSSNSTIISRQTGSVIVWSNTTSAGFLSGTNRFFFQVDTPASNATFSFIINVTDTTGIATGTNITFKLLDTTAPQFNSNTTSPSTNTKYAKNVTYTFSSTWTDKITVNTVLIEHNFTGTMTNYTMSATGSSYSYNYTDLGANLFVWRMYANDSINNVNATDQYVFNVSKGDNIIELFFNGNRNSDIQTSNESALNVTANTSSGSVFIFRNGNLVASGITPQSSSDTITSGTYTYKANATGNSNYTDNSTGITFTASLTGPAPKWSSNTTSLPSSYSNSSASTFQVAWNDKSDANGFNIAMIETNYTGTVTNFTMYRIPGTNNSAFNATLAGGAVTWKAYANNSNGVFNSTPTFTATLAKATPGITISSGLGFTADVGASTNVTCGVDTPQATVKLYRGEASVSNPDAATLKVGKYTYKCNNTETQNYSSTSKSQDLQINSFTKYLSIVNISSALKLVDMVENSSKTIEVSVRNTGNLTDTVSFSIQGINSSWFSIDVTASTLQPRGGSATFKVTFSVGFVEIKDYPGKFVFAGSNETLVSDFILRVLPSDKTKQKINDTFALYKIEYLQLEAALNESKTQNKNVTAFEDNFSQIKSKLAEAESNIAQGEYFKAAQILSHIKSLLDSTKDQLSKAQIVVKTGIGNVTSTDITIYVIIAIALIGAGVLAYLFWPTKGKTSPPVGQAPSVLEKLKEKVKDVLKKRDKYKYEYGG